MYQYLLLTILTFVAVSCNDVKEEVSDRGAHSDKGALWFGPRLGKRSLKIATEDNRPFLRLLEAADALKFYYDQLPFYESQVDEPSTRVTKKVIFTPKLGRSLSSPYEDRELYDNVEFTPRLGRRFSLETASTPSDQEYYNSEAEMINKNRLFSPRLGRTMFSPRLGRELGYENFPGKVRVVRSANKTKSD